LTLDLDWKTKLAVSMLPPLSDLPQLSNCLFDNLASGTKNIDKAPLVRCKKCFLTVHELCYYGTVENKQNNELWLCDRCQKSTSGEVSAL